MKKDFFNIEDLAQGRCAAFNDGTLEELREVLKRAFPDDRALVVGDLLYYFKSPSNPLIWRCDSSTDLPTQSVKDFLRDFKAGEELKSSTDGFLNRQPHSFCETPEEKCTMNYCDENGCQNRVRHLVEERHSHYNNENGSLYKIAEQLGLNAYEFDILKRIARCRKKGQFKQDLQKIKDTVDLYLKEVEHD